MTIATSEHAAASLLKALAHPLRLRILEELRYEGEACVCHLEWRLGVRQAAISQQLARLREAGLVIDRREGMNVFYALAKPAVGALLDAAWTAAQSESMQAAREPQSRGLPSSGPCGCPKCRAKQATG